MNGNAHFEDDDLALYAMHLLAEPESSVMSRNLAESEEERHRLGAIQASLAMYAEASIDLQPVPEGSLERLMSRVAQERRTLVVSPINAPVRTAAAMGQRRLAGVVPWLGWALAASLAIMAAKLYQDRSALLNAKTGNLAQVTGDVYTQREMLQGTLAEQGTRIEQLTADTVKAKSDNESLRLKIANQTAALSKQNTSIADAERQRDVLQGTVSAQASQVAGLTADGMTARKVLEALSDATALKVTLTKPKSRPAPNGRAIYAGSRGTLVFLASNLSPLKAGKVYQLWLMPADGSSPVPAGTFSPDAQGGANLVFGQFPRVVDAKGFSVTIENQGGALIPSLPIILAGTASA